VSYLGAFSKMRLSENGGAIYETIFPIPATQYAVKIAPGVCR
jgi:hypothetical protein